jgi:hypothetical protein
VGKKLLLISQKPEDIEFATQVVATSEMDLLTATDAAEGANFIQSQDCVVILVDASTEEQYKAFELAIQETVGMFSDKINSNAIHFLSSSPLEEVPYLIQSPIFGHYILRNYGSAKEAGEHYGRIIGSALGQQTFQMSAFLGPKAKIQNIKLQSTSQKQEAVEAIKNYLQAAQFNSRMATVISNAVDEILMNAMFDAPIDTLGKTTLAQTPRSTVLALEGQHAVEMNVGFDGTYVAISAVDHFGSLDKAKLLKHISKIYTDEEYQLRTAVAGAGIGLATVFRSGGSFYFVSENRVRTEVTVFFKKTENFREFKDQFRFISTQFYF